MMPVPSLSGTGIELLILDLLKAIILELLFEIAFVHAPRRVAAPIAGGRTGPRITPAPGASKPQLSRRFRQQRRRIDRLCQELCTGRQRPG